MQCECTSSEYVSIMKHQCESLQHLILRLAYEYQMTITKVPVLYVFVIE